MSVTEKEVQALLVYKTHISNHEQVMSVQESLFDEETVEYIESAFSKISEKEGKRVFVQHVLVVTYENVVNFSYISNTAELSNPGDFQLLSAQVVPLGIMLRNVDIFGNPTSYSSPESILRGAHDLLDAHHRDFLTSQNNGKPVFTLNKETRGGIQELLLR